jgi:hypothetical protein
MGRMSELEETSKERLKFSGTVTMKPVSKPELETSGLGANPASTLTTKDLSKHVIMYATDTRLEDFVFFHEFCHVKLNELGFKKVEALVEEKIPKCCSSASETNLMRVSHVLVSEALANSILYRFFRKESEEQRDELDYSFLMTGNLRNLERRLGQQAIIQAAGYRVSKERAGLGENLAMRRAVQEAFGDGQAAKDYDRVYAVMAKLPRIGSDGVMKELDDAEVKATVDCALELFEVQTGKRCD